MNAREVALHVVRDVFPNDNAIVRGAQESMEYRASKAKLDARDRAFATELAYGAIKMRRALDWYLEPFIGERRNELPPVTHEILRLAAYELRYTRADVHATVFEFVELAKRHGHRGLANLVNGVLRTMLREEPLEPERALFESDDDYLGTKYSLPTWLVRQWRCVFGDSLVGEICAGVNRPAQTAIVANAHRLATGQLADELRESGVETSSSPYVPEALLVASGGEALRASEAQGRWWRQSESSAMAVEVLQPQPGERILDVASGRGNKALQIADRLNGRGVLTCIDRDARKMQLLERRLSEAEMSAAMVVADVTAEGVLEGARFDRVLLDAPCSGTGVVGRHPEARWKKRSTDGERLAATQHAMLNACVPHLFAGGALVYAVCSVDPREGVEVVNAFAARNNVARGLIPAAFESFITEEGDVLIPPGIDGRDGFYIARLESGT
jgi:16S rRNA (cytosine967-C5)-methyltransferase